MIILNTTMKLMDKVVLVLSGSDQIGLLQREILPDWDHDDNLSYPPGNSKGALLL
jgi:hypothetical protein